MDVLKKLMEKSSEENSDEIALNEKNDKKLYQLEKDGFPV